MTTLVGQTERPFLGPAYQYIRESDHLPSTDAAAYHGLSALATIHLFCATGDWYIAGFDPETGLAYGVVRLFEAEAGDFDMNELVALRTPPFRLPIERETYFEPRTLGALIEQHNRPAPVREPQPIAPPKPIRDSEADYAVYARAKGARTYTLVGQTSSYAEALADRRHARRTGAKDVECIQIPPGAIVADAIPSKIWPSAKRELETSNASRFTEEAEQVVAAHPQGVHDYKTGHNEGLALAIQQAWYRTAPEGSYVFRTASFALLSDDEPTYGVSLNLPLHMRDADRAAV